MISPDLVVNGTRPLAFCFSAIGLMTSSLTSGATANPPWTVTFKKVPKLRVTMLAVTIFYSVFRVRTPASTNA